MYINVLICFLREILNVMLIFTSTKTYISYENLEQVSRLFVFIDTFNECILPGYYICYNAS